MVNFKTIYMWQIKKKLRLCWTCNVCKNANRSYHGKLIFWSEIIATVTEGCRCCVQMNFTCISAIHVFSGFTGRLCEVNINECISEPCLNSGTCEDLINGYHCYCIDGFAGVSCDQQIDECLSNPCLNNATCLDEINGYVCYAHPMLRREKSDGYNWRHWLHPVCVLGLSHFFKSYMGHFERFGRWYYYN